MKTPAKTATLVAITITAAAAITGAFLWLLSLGLENSFL